MLPFLPTPAADCRVYLGQTSGQDERGSWFFPKQALLMLKNGNILPPHLDSACRWWHHRQEHFCTRRSRSQAQALDLPNTTWKTCSMLEPRWTHPRRCLHRNPPTHFFFFSACKSPLKKSVGMSCPPQFKANGCKWE